jgi:hypothetical protein
MRREHETNARLRRAFLSVIFVSVKRAGTILIGIGIIVALWAFGMLASRQDEKNATERRRIGNLVKPIICPKAFDQNFDFSNLKKNHFIVPMTDSCFGAIVHTPREWHNWRIQPSGDATGFWQAIWVVGEANPRGPFGPNADTNASYNQARFEGHGTLLFYTNDVP